MRVLVVTTWYPTPASPSTGVFVARDVAAISVRHDVRVLHLVAPSLSPDPGSDPVGQVPVERFVMDPWRPDHVLMAARRIRQLSRDADLVHTVAVSALLPMAGWRPVAPWVHTEHWSGLTAPQTLTPVLRAARMVVRSLLRRPDVVMVVGEDLATGVRQVRDGPVVVVPNIVEPPPVLVDRVHPDQDLRDRGALELVGVGGLIERKDPLRAVDTAAELRRRGIDARLTWVGEGPLRTAVEERARSTDVPLLLTGALSPGRVQETLGTSDLFLLPTRAETFCVAAAEALAAGRPVVVGDSGGPRSFVRPPTGRLVRPGAPAADWADAVEQVWRSSRGLSAQEVGADVARRYGAQVYADHVDEVYRAASAGRDIGSSGEPVSRLAGKGPPAAEKDVPAATLGTDIPEVDVVVAVHTPERQTERAVRSVLEGSAGVPVRVTVVCHDVAADDIAASLSSQTRADPRVRLLEHRDGVPSPTGPFMAGITAATAPWVSILGSDDRFSPGAIRHWLHVATITGAEVVLAEIELDGATVPTPPTRVGPTVATQARGGRPRVRLRRRTDLDLVRDRLSYRSAPLGLLSREAIGRTGARMVPGATVGGDVPFALRLYAGARVATADRAPYLVGTDADDRTTYVARPIRDQLLAVTHLLDDPWLSTRTAAERSVIVIKLLRIHVFGAILTRPDPAWWTPRERDDLAATTRRLLGTSPGAADVLSLADHDLLRAILDPDVPARTLIDLAHARRRHGTPRTLLAHDWRRSLDREAPLRFMTASVLARHG